MDDCVTQSVRKTAEACCKISSIWRGAPFWALNGNLAPEEIRRQIRAFSQCGLGGFFLHARTGLQTPYLSDAFFEVIGAAVDEAQKCGLQAWLYDEDRYPSGSGGGFVTRDPEYRAKGIFLEEVPASDVGKYEFPETLTAVFSAVVENDSARRVRKIRVEDVSKIAPDETLLVFYTDTISCSSWYNGFTYLDTLSEKAVRRFIDLTHENYKKHFSSQFGKVIPGIFTDEPRYGFLIDQPVWDTEKRQALPWTEGLTEDFFKHYGYDFSDHLAEYFFDVPETDSSLCRWHYIETLTRHFVDACARQTGSWCRENGLIFTGHVVAEDSLSYQTACVGSAMRFYEHMGMPGIDLLTEHHRAYQTAKQLSSAAHQFGQPRRLAECYGCTGWDFPLAGFYALGNWMYALGINFRCQHLAFYTMEGEAKRDYPCPVALHSNTPDEYRKMEEHFARLTPWLSGGGEKRNILVIHAVESAWTLFHRNWRKCEKTLRFDRKFTALTNKLLAEQLDFDYADEEILSRLGRVADGKISVGKASYQVVVVPELLTIRRTTLALLDRFRQQGGEVFCINTVPARVDCCREVVSEKEFTSVTSVDRLPELLEKYRDVSFDAGEGRCSSLLYQLRCGKDFDVLFVCNTGHPADEGEEDGASYNEPFVLERTTEYDRVVVTWRTARKAQVVELDTSEGKYYPCKSVYADGTWKIETSFSRLGTRLFIALQESGQLPVEDRPAPCRGVSRVIPVSPGKWQAELSESNCLLFDHFSETPEGEKIFVLTLDDELRRKSGLPIRDNLMLQPWCREFDEKAGRNIDIYAKFTCRQVPSGPLSLVMERPELYRCFINGKAVALKDSGFWHEAAWRRIPLDEKILCPGENILHLQTRLDARHPGLESVFLLGDFGVEEKSSDAALISPVSLLESGNWCMQGLPFYTGDVTYKTRLELDTRCTGRIRLYGFNGSVARICVDGVPCGTLLFAPGASSLVDFPPSFELSVTVSGSMRNACGPFFNKEKRPAWCGPWQFKYPEVPFRQLTSCGLDGAVEIRITE